MQTGEQVVRLLRETRPFLAAEFGVGKIGLFGLRFVELVDYLEQLLGCEVDVLTPAGLQNIRVERVAHGIAQNIVYVEAE